MPAPHLDFRYRLHLVQVGLAVNVSAVATQLDGPSSGELWTIETSVSLPDFLGRSNLEIPDGLPVVRLDRTDDVAFWRHFRDGPHLDGMVPLGNVRPPRCPGQAVPYAGEAPHQLRGWWVAADVYGRLAASMGLVVEFLDGRAATAQ